MTGSSDRILHLTDQDVEQDEYYLKRNGARFEFEEDVVKSLLGPAQKVVLDTIRQNPRITQKGIVERAGKDQAQISKILDKLGERELIKKINDGYAAHLVSYQSNLSYK